MPEYCPVCGDQIIRDAPNEESYCPRCYREGVEKGNIRERLMFIFCILFFGLGIPIAAISGQIEFAVGSSALTALFAWMLYMTKKTD